MSPEELVVLNEVIRKLDELRLSLAYRSTDTPIAEALEPIIQELQTIGG